MKRGIYTVLILGTTFEGLDGIIEPKQHTHSETELLDNKAIRRFSKAIEIAEQKKWKLAVSSKSIKSVIFSALEYFGRHKLSIMAKYN